MTDKTRRVIARASGMVALGCIVLLAVNLVRSGIELRQLAEEYSIELNVFDLFGQQSAGIISSSDGPTAVFVSTRISPGFIALCVVFGIALCTYLALRISLRRKRDIQDL